MTSSFQIGHLLDKMTSSDKDFRFMATNDLMGELQKDSIKLDDDSERKVVKMLLKLLSDKNGEVQNLAVKCMGPLVKKVKDVQVELIVDSLCNNMTSSDEQLRDISSIGLKTVIADLPISSNNIAGNVCRRITNRLSEAIEKQEDVSVLLEALDIISDLLSRFGNVLSTYHGGVLSALMPQLKSTRQAVRKRTIVALGYLVLNCNDTLYTTLINQLTGVLKSVDGSDDAKCGAVYCTYIQCIAAVCRQSGHRFGKYVGNIVPLIIKFSQEDDDELREYCLQAFEAVVRRCPQEVEMLTNEITTICLNYMKYDPNYTDDDGTEEDCMMDTDEEIIFDDEDDDDDDYSDDDDMSWKVRRSAAKCLEAIISTRRDLLCTLLTTVSPALISRFREREENVKSDIFNAYIALLKQVKIAASSNVDIDQMEEGETPVSLLQAQVPAIIRAVHIQLREKSIKTRQVCLILLKELLSAIPGSLADFIPLLMPGIQFCLSIGRYSSSNMRIDTLSFVACLLSSHPPELFHPYLNVILPLITTAVGDNFYKITAEALTVLEELVKVIRPLDRECNLDFTPYVRDVYECTLERLQTSDIDQEVKEKAISCMGQIVTNLGDRLKSEENVFLTLFIERLQNEIMRLTTVKALTKIAASPLRIDLRPVLEFGTPVLATFLRKNHRALKLSTLTLLDTLVLNYSDKLEPSMLYPIVAELPLLISDSDLHVAQLTLTLLTNIIELHPQSIDDMPVILEATITLVKSALLQGGALTAVLQFFRSLVGANIPGYGYQDLLNNLVGTVKETTGKSPTSVLHKQAVHSLAKCVAALAVTKPDNAVYLAKMFLDDLPSSRKNDVGGMFALFIIGEIGRYIDLSVAIDVKDSVLACFQHQSEEIKSAASYSLGSLAIGNMSQYVPFILHEIRVQPKRLYLLLHSLKEVILYLSSSEEGVKQLEPFVPSIWERLFSHCECQEEGTRNVVAECLGKLTLINPSVLLPQLQNCLASNSPFMRATVLTAFKSTISDQPQAIDLLLKQTIGNFLKCLEDPDLNVRKMALMAFNSAAHNKPALIRDLLDVTLPKLYAETIVKEGLIHEVEMGPFRHKVDDGLDLRKVAFECMYTLLDTCLDKFDIFEFLSHLELGLKDHYDIKMLTYLMVTRLAQLSPSAVLLRIDKLVEPLRLVCTSKVKANSVKQEYEKQDELKNSAIRTFTALLCIPDADKSSAVSDFLQHITSNVELNLIFETIQKDALLRLKHDENLMDIS